MKNILFLAPILFSSLGVLHAQDTLKSVVHTKGLLIESGCYIYHMPLPVGYRLSSLAVKEQQFSPSLGVVHDSLLREGTPLQYQIGLAKKKPHLVLRIPAYKKDSMGRMMQVQNFALQLVGEQEKNPAQRSPNKFLRTTSTASVLAEGTWQKIGVWRRGIYRVDYDYVKNVLGQSGVINSNQIRLFGNGGTMLYEANDVPRWDDLQENAIEVVDGGDGNFGPGDYFLFYANGPLEWTKDSVRQQFRHRTNLYADTSYYFVNFNAANGLRIANADIPSSPVTAEVSSYNEYALHERELVNLGRFGKTWWGETFGFTAGLSNNQNFTFSLDNIGDTIHYEYRLASAAIGMTSGSKFTVSLNGNTLGVHDNIFGVVGSDGEDPARAVGRTSFIVLPGASSLNFNIDYQRYVSEAKGYLDYIEINARRRLLFKAGDQVAFRDWRSVGLGSTARFSISGANSATRVWDITNPLSPNRISGNFSGGNFVFVQNAERLREYIAFDNSFLTPQYLGVVPNQNLHGLAQADYLIIHHPEMNEAAEKLAAYHRENNSLRVHTVPVDLIYNEFASGAKDITAIRDFVKMFYDRAGTNESQMPKYLLLLGQASYDYKNILPGNPKLVPTYETEESLSATDGYCSDDYYAILDSNEDINRGFSMMDLGVGRIPATSAAQASTVIDKILRYKSNKSLGEWRLNNMFLGDDEDGAGNHLLDADSMWKVVAGQADIYKAQKVYLDNMKFVSTPGGQRCPDANKIINDNYKKGTFLMNYSGHGSIYTLAHERIVTQDDFNFWNNAYKLPIMITATCDFSRFDNPALPSAGEKIMLKTDGGAIALVTTTQVVYASLNIIFNSSYLQTQFSKKKDGWYTLGDAFMIAKNNAPSTNTRKFALLGDPALVPNFPRYDVTTDSMHSLATDGTASAYDSVKSLGRYRIYASVRNDDGLVINDFNGKANITFYDKAQQNSVVTANSRPHSRQYTVQNNIIYRGNVTVRNGVFSFEFIAPKDINYNFGKGKILYYADNGITDAAGADTSLVVGGFADDVLPDEDAPNVRVFMNDSLFRVGGLTGTNSILYAIISDKSGINVSGNFVGHDLVAVLDNNQELPFVLNDYYETAPNTYQLGYVNFPMTGLSDGIHHIKVKAWDVFNNSGEGSTLFEVVNGNIVRLRNLYNYPNPFKQSTRFVFEHNHPNVPLKATINIFSTTGALMRTIEQDFTPTGSNTAEIMWDGTGNGGEQLAPGVYPYRIRIATEKNIEDLGYQKVVLIR